MGKFYKAVGNYALYIGYDNCDGKALGRARAIANNLKALGINAYEDAMGD